jgi:penicillin-binding protein 2
MSRIVGVGNGPSVGQRGYTAIAAIVVAAFLLLGSRLWWLQVHRGEHYYRKSADNFVKEIDLPATRGEILDRKGRLLVGNRPKYNVYLTPRFTTDESLARLAHDLRLGEDQVAPLKTKRDAKRGIERSQQMLALEDISRDDMALCESDKANLPGIAVDARSHRFYPHGRLAAHALGYMNQASAEELVALREIDRAYRSGDYVGRAGVERQWESALRGKDGLERIVVDARGRKKAYVDPREMAALIGGPLRQEPVGGNNVVLTLDLDLQQAAEKALARYPSAAAVAVEVQTGRVLALASHPAFDPNVLTGHLSRAEAQRLATDPFRPMLDKTIRENYFPGSTFKIVVALAALEEKLLDEGEKMPCSGAYKFAGRRFHCMEAHGMTDLYKAIVESCDVFFYRLGERLGLDRIARVAAAFGFGAPTEIKLPGEVPGFVATMDWYKRNGGFLGGFALNTAIGQGETKVTLLQLALAYAALANGGDLYVPQLVDRVETAAGEVVQRFAPTLRRRIGGTPEEFGRLARALCGVVADEKGTAHEAEDEWLVAHGIEVCGKTGTAQVGKTHKGELPGWNVQNDHGWFASFAPAPTSRRKAELAVVVLVEHGGLGGQVAAPVAMDIYRAYYREAARAQAGAMATATAR